VSTFNNGVIVSMGWVNSMAKIMNDGLPLNVGEMMNEFMTQNGQPESAGPGLTGLL
jgi:hypothetical protein